MVQITYLYKDALGSTIAKADDKGNILWQENRLPFGKNTKLSSSQIDKDPLQYTNAPLDSHSGLTYLKARYYNADIGRFYASDPVWYDSDNSQSFNRYAYGNNNPYTYKDPNGSEGIMAQRLEIFAAINGTTVEQERARVEANSKKREAFVKGAAMTGVKTAGEIALEVAPVGG